MGIHFAKNRYGKLQVVLMLVVLMAIVSGPSDSSAGGVPGLDKKVPFSPGERFVYRGRWGVLRAGEVTLEVLPKETINGLETYHFTMITKTNDVVDLLYKIREHQDSYIDTNITHSILYKKRTESKHPRDVIVNFNWAKSEATYANFGEKTAPIHILPGTFDPLALFFILRLQDFRENSVIEIPVTDGNMNIGVKATVAKRETIMVEEKTYDTFAVTPDMERLENIVKKSDDPRLKIWFTADDKKIPVKIQSKVALFHSFLNWFRWRLEMLLVPHYSIRQEIFFCTTSTGVFNEKTSHFLGPFSLIYELDGLRESFAIRQDYGQIAMEGL